MEGNFCTDSNLSIFRTKTTAAQNEDALSCHRVRGLYLGCLKMIYTCTLYPIQWELAKNEGHSVRIQTILH